MPRPPPASRVWFVILAMGGAVGLLAGCAKTDPLDERVDAKSMNRLLRWQKKHVEPLGEPIVSEFAEAITIMARKTAGYKAPSTTAEYRSPFNPLCRRLDGMRLRQVIIDGYDLLNGAMQDRIFTDRLNVDKLRIRMNDEGTNLTRLIAREEKMIRHWEDRVRRNQARIRELRNSAP